MFINYKIIRKTAAKNQKYSEKLPFFRILKGFWCHLSSFSTAFAVAILTCSYVRPPCIYAV